MPNPLSFAVTLFFITAMFELVLVVSARAWQHRRILAGANLSLISIASGMLVIAVPNTVTILLFVASVYRIINMLRIVENRMNEAFQRRTVSKTTLNLLGVQGLLFAYWALAHVADIKTTQLLWLAVILQLLASVALFLFTVDNLRRYRFRTSSLQMADVKLPSITVAIPARNEMEYLAECIETVLASDYPKLEILVLDDCSHDSTGEIVKGYAHKGVRFIKGEPPADDWLAKNNAYDQLATEATGKYVVFIGVDVRLDSGALRALIHTVLAERLQMLSVLPGRTAKNPLGLLVQPMRYWWELALPRRFFRSPACLSTIWAIERSVLVELGGFAAVKRKIRPETYFAREIYKQNGYAFMFAGNKVGIQSVKTPLRQFDTAIRTRYPEMHRQPERVMLVTVLEALLFVGPFIVLGVNAVTSLSALLVGLAGIAALCLTLTHVLILRVFVHYQALLGFINYPLVALIELALVNISMWRYEFSQVIWRGRNICVPVMHVYKHLPKIASGATSDSVQKS